eukprot:TRINITY_DN8095_c0_g2_i1.p1 TRINITY_DN8095_c0_g2~~TRINITY_DN8095_c0_g2_i1.p1  ORF type:complete len:113 (+),score=14.00 TRINITY_DN8095_c0_g2_i1:63-401(+)
MTDCDSAWDMYSLLPHATREGTKSPLDEPAVVKRFSVKASSADERHGRRLFFAKRTARWRDAGMAVDLLGPDAGTGRSTKLEGGGARKGKALPFYLATRSMVLRRMYRIHAH